jgi:hypothetical protein
MSCFPLLVFCTQYLKVIQCMAVTTMRQMRQMPHTENDNFFIQRFYLENIKSKSLFR